MKAPLAVPTLQLKTEMAPGHYLHIKYGVLCYGERLKDGLLKIQNASFRSEEDVNSLINLIEDTKDPVVAVKLFLRGVGDLKSELVLGAVSTTSLWSSHNLANFSEVAKIPSPSLFKLNQMLKFYRVSSGEAFPEVMPIARIPILDNFKDRARMVFYHSDETKISASRYCFSTTHQEAVSSLITERSFCAVETKSYQLLRASFGYSPQNGLFVFIPTGENLVSLENACYEHFKGVMSEIDPAIKVRLEFTDHCLF